MPVRQLRRRRQLLVPRYLLFTTGFSGDTARHLPEIFTSGRPALLKMTWLLLPTTFLSTRTTLMEIISGWPLPSGLKMSSLLVTGAECLLVLQACSLNQFLQTLLQQAF